MSTVISFLTATIAFLVQPMPLGFGVALIVMANLILVMLMKDGLKILEQKTEKKARAGDQLLREITKRSFRLFEEWMLSTEADIDRERERVRKLSKVVRDALENEQGDTR